MTPAFSDALYISYVYEYMEKIFYFSLKKTGKAHEAEDLTSDITLCVMNGLYRGAVPQCFGAWVWQIARNRYAAWADRKNKTLKSLSGADVLDIPEEEQPLADNVDAECINREQAELLRRELAFISGEYRELLVAYYFKKRRIGEIAKSMHIPEGTVKIRLFRARNILKEGMNMARVFGKRSYTPEELAIIGSGNHTSGLPDSALSRKIPKNIVLEAHNNPSTAEEMSIELGIALPYIEEEINILYNASLLEKTDGDRYVTNFFIADEDTQNDICDILERCKTKLSEMVWDIALQMLPAAKEAGVKAENMSDGDFLWLIACQTVDSLLNQIPGMSDGCHIKRPDGGDWGLYGYAGGNSKIGFMGQNGTGNNKAMIWIYGPHDFGMSELMGKRIFIELTLLLASLLIEKVKINDLFGMHRSVWENACGPFAHEGPDGMAVPDISVYMPGTFQNLWDKRLKKCSLYMEARKLFDDIFNGIKSYLRERTDPILHRQLDYVAGILMSGTRMLVVRDLVSSGKLIIPEHPATTNATTYLVINEW